MIKAHLSSVSILAVLFGLNASCSSDDDKPAPGGSAGTGSGNVSGGGAAASGGSVNTGATNTGGSGDVGEGGGPGVNPNACPDEKPAAASACTRFGGQPCTYDDGGCVCNDELWECYSSADCPSSAPADAEACTLNGMECAFDPLVCRCSVDDGWSCETPCPSMVPAAATECMRDENRACRYDADGGPVNGPGGMAETTCTCTDGAFNCVSQADCPAELPTNASACMFPTLSCDFDGGNCTCEEDETWSCALDCPEATPADGDSCQRSADQSCRYGAGVLVQGGGQGGSAVDTSCACVDGAFDCSTAADCPATVPADASACTLSGITCPYDAEATSCRCRTSTAEWDCSMSDPGGGGTGGGGAGGGGAGGGGGGGGT